MGLTRHAEHIAVVGVRDLAAGRSERPFVFNGLIALGLAGCVVRSVGAPAAMVLAEGAVARVFDKGRGGRLADGVAEVLFQFLVSCFCHAVVSLLAVEF